jgi:carbamoyltransferase
MNYTVSIHTKHDANMTISSVDRIIEYVEFEKVVGQRYFNFSKDEKFEEEFYKYIFPFLKEFKHRIDKINFCWLTDFQKSVFLKVFPECNFEEKKHHISHAFSLYAFTKPKDNDLIISIDGGGDEDDYFKIFKHTFSEITLIDEVKLNLGTPYRMLGLISEEIISSPTFEFDTNMHLPGKIMGLAPLGKVVDEYIDHLKIFYTDFLYKQEGIINQLKQLLTSLQIIFSETLKVNKDTARDILRTSQTVFEKLFFEHTANHINNCNRVLLVGGCALNVKLNSSIFENSGKEVFVSPVAGDCGISLGAAMSDFSKLSKTPFQNAFIGLKAIGKLTAYIPKYNPIKVTTRDIAKYLSEDRIVATMIENIEAGPRSLGNRSLLANPLQKGIKDKLNQIKEREFFRPIAPIVTDKKQNLYFEQAPLSKYMTFAPRINREYKYILSEIVHYDETCRIQTVTQQESFLYNLLIEFGKLTGYEILANTSFNSKGKPIINDIDEAFELLESTEIDFLLIDDLLFEKQNL